MSLTIKICGLNSAPSVEVALEAGADMLGFVFFPASPRHLAYDEAAALAAPVARRARKVALTVDADDDTLRRAVEAIRPDLLQFHGRETPERLRAVKAAYGLPIIKAFPVGTRDDLTALNAYAGVADMVLLDARAPKDAARPGGHGQSFDWALISDFAPKAPWLLSGGLNAQNVATALAVTGAPGIDVSSGVESAPGRKDAALIREFIRLARAAPAREVPAPPSGVMKAATSR